MTDLLVSRSRLSGEIQVPPSKSHSIRAILFAAMAEGRSTVRGVLQSPDSVAAIQACRQLGATIHQKGDCLFVEGVAGKPKVPDDVIDAGNSGQVLRFVGALSGLCEGYTVITGDTSVRSQRPVNPLLDGLRGLGALAESSRGNGCAPIIIKGPIKAGRTLLCGEDSQPVSGLLIAAAFLDGITEVAVMHPGEKPWIDLTLSWLQRVGISCENDNYERYRVVGQKQPYPGFDVTIPGDFSSAAYPIVAALLTGSDIVLSHVDMSDVQGDKKIIPILQQMGAQIEFDASHKKLFVRSTTTLRGATIDVNPLIDAITILAVVGCFAEGETHLINGAIARRKESDRIACIAKELRCMGADIQETHDGLIIKKSALKAANVRSHEDHRMAMSLAVAAMACDGTSRIQNSACVAKSYPLFADHMQQLGAAIQS